MSSVREIVLSVAITALMVTLSGKLQESIFCPLYAPNTATIAAIAPKLNAMAMISGIHVARQIRLKTRNIVKLLAPNGNKEYEHKVKKENRN